MNLSYPFKLISGKGLGLSYSSYTQIGAALPSRDLGLLKIQSFVNVNTGNLILFDHKLELVEKNFPLELYYVYNCHAKTADSIWRLAHKYLKTVPASATAPLAILVEADGHETPYHRDDKTGHWLAPCWSDSRPYLSHDEALKQWKWFDPKTQISEIYDEQGHLTQRLDSENRATKYYYERMETPWRLYRIETPGSHYEIRREDRADGSYIESFYRISSEEPRLLKFSLFDRAARLIQTTIALDDPDQSKWPYVNYGYRASDESKIVSVLAYLNELKQSDGSYFYFSYGDSDSTKKPIRQFVCQRSTGTGDIVLASFSYAGGKTSIEDFAKVTAKLYFNEQGSITQIDREKGYALHPGNSIDSCYYTYYENNQLASMTSAGQGTQSFEYDPSDGQLIKQERANGQITEYYYDKTSTRHNRITQVNYSNATAQVTRKVYDQAYGRSAQGLYLRFEISPEGRVREYHDLGRDSIRCTILYLEGRFPVERYAKHTAPSLAEMTNWVSQQNLQQRCLTEYHYDTGYLPRQTYRFANIDNKGQGIRDDSMCQLITRYTIFGDLYFSSEVREKDAPELQTLRRFDNLRRLLFSQNAADEKTAYLYADRRVEITRPNGRCEVTEWDTRGWVIKEQQTIQVNNQAITREISYSHHVPGCATEQCIGLDGQISYRFYDTQSRLGFKVHPSGALTEYRYDAQNCYKTTIRYAKRIDKEKLLEGLFPKELPDTSTLLDLMKAMSIADPLRDRTAYDFYDESERLIYQVDEESYITQRVYNHHDQVVAQIQHQARLQPEQLADLQQGKNIVLPIDPSRDRIQRSFYDADQQIIGLQDAAGYVTEYKRNGANWVTEIIRYAQCQTINIYAQNFDKVRPPTFLGYDAHEYNFYDRRGWLILSVDAEGYITTKDYLLNGVVSREKRYANPVDMAFYNNTRVVPPLPADSADDQTISYVYDALNREIETHRSDGRVTFTHYNNMGEIIARGVRDALTTEITGDTYRANEFRLDGWGQTMAEASAQNSALLAQIDADSTLKPDEKQQQKETVWKQQTQRHVYELSGLKVSTTLRSSPEANDQVTYYYYNIDRHLLLTIQVIAEKQVRIHEYSRDAFNRIIKTRDYSQVNATLADKFSEPLTGGFLSESLRNALDALQDDTQDVITHKAYNKRSEVIQGIDAEGYETQHIPNAFGEISQSHLPVQTKQPSLIVQHKYDTRGLEIQTRHQADDASIKIKRDYGNFYGKLTHIKDALNGNYQHQYDRKARLIWTQSPVHQRASRIAYDAWDRTTKVSNALGQTTRYLYNQNQRQQIIIDPLGNRRLIIQNIFAEKITETDAHQQTQTWQHTCDGKISRYRDALGRGYVAVYNLLGNLTEKQILGGIKTVYVYDAIGQLNKKIQDVDGLKRQTQYHYNLLGRCIKTIDPRGIVREKTYDQRGNVIKKCLDPNQATQSGLALQTMRDYNGQSKLTREAIGDAQVPEHYIRALDYDGLNRHCVTTIDPLSSTRKDALNIRTQQHKNGRDMTLAEIDANGQLTRFIVDLAGRRCFQINALGGVTEWKYNDADQAIFQRQYQLPLAEKKRTQINDGTTPDQLRAMLKSHAEDSLTYHYYDANGNPCFTVDCCGKQATVSEKRYDALQREIQTIQYASVLDAQSLKQLSTEQLAKQLIKIADPTQDRMNYFLRDEVGQLRFTIDPAQYIHEQRFDTQGRLISQIDYANPVTDPARLAKLPLTEVIAHIRCDESQDRYQLFFFDSLGQPLYSVNPEGQITGYQHDANGNLTEQVHFNQRVVVPQDYVLLQSQLNALKPDPKQDRITRKIYDAANRLIQKTDALAYVESYQYDAADNRISYSDRQQSVWKTIFDSAKRAIVEVTPTIPITQVTQVASGQLVATPLSVAIEKHKVYDKVGNICRITSAANTTEPRIFEAEYNALNQWQMTHLPEISVDDAGALKPEDWRYRPEKKQTLSRYRTTNAKGLKVAEQDHAGHWQFWVYDEQNRPLYEVTPLGITRKKEYDAFGQVRRQIINATPCTLDLSVYSKTGIPKSVLEDYYRTRHSDADRLIDMQYDQRGRVIYQRQGPVYCYTPKSSLLSGSETQLTENISQQKAEIKKSYNAWGQLIYQSEKIDAVRNKKSFYWFNRNGQCVAEAEAIGLHPQTPSYRCKRYEKDSFDQTISRYAYAQPLLSSISSQWSLEKLTQSLDQMVSSEDRCDQFHYDKAGRLLKKVRKQAIRQTLQLADGLPGLVDKSPHDLSVAYQYNPNGLVRAKTYEDGSIEWSYYDKRGCRLAQTDVARDNAGLSDPMVPLTYYGNNAHGQVVSITRFKQGAKPATADSFPQPRAFDSADQQQLLLFDTRGKLHWKQSAQQTLQGISYTANGKLARQWQTLSNWQQTEANQYQQISDLDEKYFQYDAQDRSIRSEVRRNTQVVDLTVTRYDAFDQSILEGKDPDNMSTYRHFDKLGRLWSSNAEGGIPTLYLYDLTGQCALRMQSARQDLSRISYAELPNLLSWDITDLERTENQRDLAGRVVTRALPANYQWDPSQAQIIPLSLLASALYPDFGKIQSLSWSIPQERNVEAEFSLWPKDLPDLKQTLPLITQGERCGVDVSSLASDVYDYQVNYYLSEQADPNNPNPSKRLSFISSGTVQFDTGNTTNSHHLVAISDAKQTTLVRLSGNTRDITAVELWRDLEKRAILELQLDPATHDYYVDLSGHSSGVYQLKPQKKDKTPQALSLDVTIYSDKPAHKPLSRELTSALSVRFLANHAEINWQLPPFLQAQSVKLECRYLDDKDQTQSLSGQISPSAKRTRYVDKAGKEIQSNVDFEQPIKAIAGLSLAVLWPSQPVTDSTTPLKDHWLVLATTSEESSDEEDWEMLSNPSAKLAEEEDQDWIPLYIDVAPSASPFDPDIISKLGFSHKRLLMVSPVLDLKEAKEIPVLEYLDVSLDRMRCWKKFPSIHVSTRGFSVDVSGFAAGVYPFRCGEHAGDLVIAREGQVFPSPNTIEPDRQHLVQPARRYRYDLWNNRLSETDSLGHTTEFIYNDADQPLQTREPAVEVLDEQGIAKTICPVTRFGYNERGVNIGTQDAHGNTCGSIVDAAGHLIIELLADGTKRKTQLFDALNNIYETHDAAGQITQYWHDKENNLLKFQQPSGRRHVYSYNPLKRRISVTGPAGNTRRYNFDALGNVNQRYEPLGQSTRMLYGPYRQLMAVENPDGSRLSWQRDAFGKAIQHTDLSGAVYQYQYDNKKQLIEASSQGGDHGQYLQLDPHILQFNNGSKIDVYELTPKPVPGQQLKYQYISGRVTELADLATGKTTYYSYDSEGRRIGMRLVGQKGELLRETSAENDALGREILTRDNQAVFTTAYDAVSNRRYIKGVVNTANGETLKQEVWWKYDAQDRVLLAEGILENGEIKLTSNQGSEFTYQADRRISEAQLDERNDKRVANLQYDVDGRLIGSTYYMATDPEICERTEREYDLAGWQKNYRDIFPGDAWQKEYAHIRHERICNENAWLTADIQIVDEGDPIRTDYQELNALGLPQRQVIHYNDESANEDHLDYHYVGWDEWRVARIEGYRSNRHGRSPYSSVQHFIGPNGEPNAVIGAQNADSREDQHKYFQATADGLVIRRLYFEKKWFTFDYFVISKETSYFYRVNGQYLGSYEGDKQSGFGLNFVRHEQRNRAGRELGISLMDGMNPGRAISFSPLGSNHSLKYDQTYGQSDALASIPATYTSVAGDSYAAIAEKIYGDAGLASYIEAANGGGALIAGQTLTIPPLIVVRNKAGMALPYYQLLQIMQGSLLPHLQTPQPQEHHSFWGTLLRAIVVVVVVVFAPELVAALPAVLAGMVGLSHVILTAVVAGLMDAAAQGFCVGLGLLDHFSLEETLTVMITSGLSAQLPAGGLSAGEAKSAEAIAEHMLKVGMVNVEEQFAEMAIGVREQFDLAGVALAMGSAGLGDKIGAELKLDNPWVQRSLTDIGTAAMSGVVRGQFDIESLATQLIADNISVTIQQMKTPSKSEEAYHQSQQASQGRIANDIDEQWQTEFINDAKLAANTPLPSISFDVEDSWTAAQLGQQVGEEVSRFQHVDLPRNPNGFWQCIERSYENVFEHRALIAEGRAAANSESMRESLAGATANEQNYLDLGYSESVADTQVAWITGLELSFITPERFVPRVGKGIMQAVNLANRWGFWNRTENQNIVDPAEKAFYLKARLMSEHDFYHPGSVPNDFASTFNGYRYKAYQLKEDFVFYRAGSSERPLGRFFSFEKPISELQVRIDKAVLPTWSDGSGSIIDTGYAISIPKGSVVHVGDIAQQGGIFLGGTKQIYIDNPWLVPDVKIIDEYSLREELLFNLIAKKSMANSF